MTNKNSNHNQDTSQSEEAAKKAAEEEAAKKAAEEEAAKKAAEEDAEKRNEESLRQKQKEAKEAALEAKKNSYRVAPGHSISCLRGILDAGVVITPKDLMGGKESFNQLIKRKVIIK